MDNETDKEIESPGQVEHRKLSRWAPWSLIFGILSLLFVCVFYPVYKVHPPDIDLLVIPITFILIIPPVICGCVAIYRINKDPLRYRGTWLALVGIGFASILLFLSIPGSIVEPFLAINTLRSELQDVTLIKVRPPWGYTRVVKGESLLFEEKDPATIAKVIRSIDIAPFGCTRFVCACRGNLEIEFCREGKDPVVMEFHRPQRLRWLSGWDGDVVLTRKSVSFLAD